MSRKNTITKLLAYIQPYTALFILSVLTTFATVLCSLMIPVLFGKGVDCIISEGNVDINLIIHIAFVLILVTAIGAFCQYLTGYLNNAVTFKIIRALRDEVFKKIHELPLSYLDQQTSGEMLSRCVTDIEQISDGLLMGFSSVVNGALTIICAVVFMAFINPVITIAVVLLSPASFALTKFIATRTRSMFKKQSISRGEMTSFTDEAIENMKLIYAFGHADMSRAEFNEKNNVLSEYSLKATFYSSLVNPSTRIIYSVLYALVTIIGGFYCISGYITIGNLSALLGYTNQYSKPFNEITGTITEFQNAIASASRVFEILDIKSAENPGDPIPVIENALGEITFDDVSFSYKKDVPLISRFNINVKPGARVAIVGPTGCGKTTLINLLMRFYNVNKGRITIDGKDIYSMSHVSARSYFGMVLQDIWLKTGTIRENIAFGRPEASLKEVKAAAYAAYADDFIEKLPDGYDTVIGEDGGNLSEGQKQLLCIARVMIKNPFILILDEATSSVDSMTEIRINKAFENLMKRHTSFIVAHRLSTIVNSDLILVMDHGSIVEKGTHKELLENHGFYYKLYHSQRHQMC